MIQTPAYQQAENAAEAAAFRNATRQSDGGPLTPPGGILATLRRSMLVGAELDLTRAQKPGRKLKLFYSSPR